MRWVALRNRIVWLGILPVPCRENLPPDWALIETKGDEPGKVNLTRWDPIVGDFMYIAGDPTHWRFANPKLRRFQMKQIIR